VNQTVAKIRNIVLALLVLIVIGAAVAYGIAARRSQHTAISQQTRRDAEPSIAVLHPSRGAPAEEVILPGNIQAFADAPIFARTSGYLKKWYFDMGAHVKKGDLLAEIESPEVDRQLQQAKEDLNTAQANLKLAQITASRYSDLFKSDSVAKQDVDNAVQDAAAKTATVKSAQANVERLQELVDFEKVYAPFDGVVTARNTDVGQLINSGSVGNTSTPSPAPNNTGTGSSATRELFHVSAVHTLRVFVQIPQTYSHAAVPGIRADLTLPELPGRRFEGKIVRTARAIDPTTRTLLVEVDVPNTAGLLFPGAYAEIHFRIKSNAYTLIIPSTSLIFRSQGLRVPLVGRDNRVTLRPVTVGRDFGSTVEVLSGLGENDSVVANPPDSLVEGELVHIVRSRSNQEVAE
jgi:multidrug efflux pump subunit AcrA (membrane-fusion protein)